MKLFDKYIGKAKEKKVKTVQSLWDEFEEYSRKNHQRVIGGPAGMEAFRRFLASHEGVTVDKDIKSGKKDRELGRILIFNGTYNGKPFEVEGSSQGFGILIGEK